MLVGGVVRERAYFTCLVGNKSFSEASGTNIIFS